MAAVHRKLDLAQKLLPFRHARWFDSNLNKKKHIWHDYHCLVTGPRGEKAQHSNAILTGGAREDAPDDNDDDDDDDNDDDDDDDDDDEEDDDDE